MIGTRRQGEPGFREALAVARVQYAVRRSWEEVGTAGTSGP